MGRLLLESLVMVALLTIGLLTAAAGALSLFLLSAFIGSGGRDAGPALLFTASLALGGAAAVYGLFRAFRGVDRGAGVARRRRRRAERDR